MLFRSVTTPSTLPSSAIGITPLSISDIMRATSLIEVFGLAVTTWAVMTSLTFKTALRPWMEVLEPEPDASVPFGKLAKALLTKGGARHTLDCADRIEALDRSIL